MPLTNDSRSVSGFTKFLGQGGDIRFDHAERDTTDHLMGLVVPHCMTPRKKAVPRGCANRGRGMSVREPNPMLGDGIQLRRLNELGAIAGEISVTNIVGQDDHHVGCGWDGRHSHARRKHARHYT